VVGAGWALTRRDVCGCSIVGGISCCIGCVGGGWYVSGLTFDLNGVDPIGVVVVWLNLVTVAVCGEGGQRRINSCRRQVILSLWRDYFPSNQ